MMYLGYIKTALEGARYHEDQAFLLADPKKEEYNKIIFHLRAYFWELFSVWDYVLQQANTQTIKLNPYGVRRKLIEKIEKERPEYKHIGLLKDIRDNDKMKKIMLIRDYAHK